MKKNDRINVKILYYKSEVSRKYNGEHIVPTPEQIKTDYLIVFDKQVRFTKDYPTWLEASRSICEQLYYDANVHDIISQKRARIVGHTSMSVGDIVIIGEGAWICAPMGFNPVMMSELPRSLV
jgi:hypothetical protein